MELAASWKPVDEIEQEGEDDDGDQQCHGWFGGSVLGLFHDDGFDDVGDVFALIGGRFSALSTSFILMI